MVALYTARICEFFVERLCSGLWSGSFSVFRLDQRFLEQQSYMQCAFSCILFLSIIFQSVRVVTFVQDANHEQQLVSYVFSGYRAFAFFQRFYPSFTAKSTCFSAGQQRVSTGNLRSSRGIAPSVAIFPSRFKWRELKHGRDVWFSLLAFDF